MKTKRIAVGMLTAMLALGLAVPAAIADPGTPKPNPATHGGPPHKTRPLAPPSRDGDSQ
jgi:hypothetical protein